MKKILLISVTLALAACAQAQNPPAGLQTLAAPAPTPKAEAAPQPPPGPAFPLSINGPDGKALVVIQADGTFQGDADKLGKLLALQKGGVPQENVLMALVLHALRGELPAKPKTLEVTTPTGG